jgi:hypothetical protein
VLEAHPGKRRSVVDVVCFSVEDILYYVWEKEKKEQYEPRGFRHQTASSEKLTLFDVCGLRRTLAVHLDVEPNHVLPRHGQVNLV